MDNNMSHGEVRTYYLTEEERLAYVEKHPIISEKQSPIERKPNTEELKRVGSNGGKAAAKSRGRNVSETIDKTELHRRFIAGENLKDIAVALNISEGNLHYCIKKFREVEPDKWPKRSQGRGKGRGA